jgi:hypothetical protein
MIVRQWVGDLAFAILLTLPLAALARPLAVSPQKAVLTSHVVSAHSLAGTARTSVLGS